MCCIELEKDGKTCTVKISNEQDVFWKSPFEPFLVFINYASSDENEDLTEDAIEMWEESNMVASDMFDCLFRIDVKTITLSHLSQPKKQ